MISTGARDFYERSVIKSAETPEIWKIGRHAGKERGSL
jgi:hypothetical protein